MASDSEPIVDKRKKHHRSIDGGADETPIKRKHRRGSRKRDDETDKRKKLRKSSDREVDEASVKRKHRRGSRKQDEMVKDDAVRLSIPDERKKDIVVASGVKQGEETHKCRTRKPNHQHRDESGIEVPDVVSNVKHAEDAQNLRKRKRDDFDVAVASDVNQGEETQMRRKRKPKDGAQKREKLVFENLETDDTDVLPSSDNSEEDRVALLAALETQESSSRLREDFEVKNRLGKGGFGHVHRAIHKMDKHEYAIKVMKLDGAREKQHAQREIEIMAILKHHYIVGYNTSWKDKHLYTLTADDDDEHDYIGDDTELGEYESMGMGYEELEADYADGEMVSETDLGEFGTVGYELETDYASKENGEDDLKFLCIQMEYCSRTLSDILATGKRMKETVVVRFFRQIVEALCYIHEKGIVHGDLYSKNILIGEDNNVRVCDFGLAKSLNMPPIEGKFVANVGDVSSPISGAPEMGDTEKADIYTLGLILFDLYHPFKSKEIRRKAIRKLVGKNKVDDRSWVKKYRKPFHLLKMLMSSRPEDRPSAEEILNVLIDTYLVS